MPCTAGLSCQPLSGRKSTPVLSITMLVTCSPIDLGTEEGIANIPDPGKAWCMCSKHCNTLADAAFQTEGCFQVAAQMVGIGQGSSAPWDSSGAKPFAPACYKTAGGSPQPPPPPSPQHFGTSVVLKGMQRGQFPCWPCAHSGQPPDCPRLCRTLAVESAD